jgi:hypothetical protein
MTAATPSSASSPVRANTHQPDPARQHRRGHQRQGKHQADAGAHDRHRFGAHHVARLIRQQRRDSRRHRTSTLHRAADGQPGQRRRPCRHQAAGGEHQQTEHDHGFAPDPVRSQAIQELQQGLREAVNAHGQSDHGGVVATGVTCRLDGKHRQNQKQAQHAQGKDGGQRKTGAQFQRRHGGSGLGAGRPQRGIHI